MSYMALSRASRSSAVPQIPKNRPGVPAFLQKLFECVLSRHYMETAYLDTECWATFIVKTSSVGQTLLIHSLVCLLSFLFFFIKSLIVLDHERFAREILPRWFKHQNFASFVRQLNMYGFHKIPHLQQGVLRSDTGETEYWNFAHENFRRDQPDLLCLIHRKKGNLQQQPGAGAIFSPEESELLDRKTQ